MILKKVNEEYASISQYIRYCEIEPNTYNIARI